MKGQSMKRLLTWLLAAALVVLVSADLSRADVRTAIDVRAVAAVPTITVTCMSDGTARIIPRQ